MYYTDTQIENIVNESLTISPHSLNDITRKLLFAKPFAVEYTNSPDTVHYQKQCTVARKAGFLAQQYTYK